MDADLDTLCTVIYCTADDLLPEARRNAGAASPTPSWSRSAWRRQSWASPLTAASWRWRGGASSISFRTCPASPPTGSAAAGSPRRSSGSWPTSPSRARASRTTCCWSTRRRSSARGAVRPPSVRPWGTRPATATAAATRAGTGPCACTCSPLPTARPAPTRSPIPPVASVRSHSNCLRGACARAARSFSATRATPAASSPRPRPSRASSSVRPVRRDEPGPQPAPRAHPPAHREHLLDLQGPAHARASRPPHPGRAARAHPAAVPLPGCLHQPQPPAGQAEPCSRRLLRLRPRGRGINHLAALPATSGRSCERIMPVY